MVQPWESRAVGKCLDWNRSLDVPLVAGKLSDVSLVTGMTGKQFCRSEQFSWVPRYPTWAESSRWLIPRVADTFGYQPTEKFQNVRFSCGCKNRDISASTGWILFKF